jgi:hypothetical protein
MKIYYNAEENEILIYLGMSSMTNFRKFMFNDLPFGGTVNCSLDYVKRFIYIGDL